MQKFTTLISTCLPLRTENIDTDQIIPARFLKTTTREGIGKYFFYNWRFDERGNEKDSVFSDEKYKHAKILVAGNNFGCGSSREHAPWAILGYGLQAIISSSFGDIFYSNCLKNGLLPVILNHDELDRLLEVAELEPDTTVTINLENQILIVGTQYIAPLRQAQNIAPLLQFEFRIDPFKKACLLNGVDELGYILSQEEKIQEFEKKYA